jgi:hypothetical protein
MQPANEVNFRVPCFKLFIVQLLNLGIVLIPFFVVGSAFIWIRTGYWGPTVIISLIETGFLLTGAALAAYIGTRKPRASLSSQGIRVPDSRGISQFAEWASITNLRYHNRLGFEYIVFDTHQRKCSMTLLCFINNMTEFVDTAAEFAGEDNPLVKKLTELGF